MDKKRAMSFTVRLIIAVVLSLLLVGGGTFAYWRWVSSTSKNVVFSTVDNIEDYINYDAGNSYFVGDFQPTSSFCQSTHTTLSFSKKELGKDHKFVATIHMDVNAIGDSIKNSSSVHWVVTTGDDNISCTQGLDSPYVINHGTFQGKSAGTSFALTDDVDLLLTMSEKKFTVWIWVDSRGSDLQSLTGQTIDTNVWTQIDMLDNMYSAKENAVGEAYAIYSETDSSLRFYRSEEPIIPGTTYNGLVATEVYTGFEDEEYSVDTDIPWYENRNNVTTVVVEDSIYPISTRGWFSSMIYVSFVDLLRLDTSVVTDMSDMFSMLGSQNFNELIISGLGNWDTSNVTDMSGMFCSVGSLPILANGAYYVEINGINNWDVSNVTNMSAMFSVAGQNADTLNISDISGWDTSSVVDMTEMFEHVNGIPFGVWELDLSSWNVSKVTDFSEFNLNHSAVEAPNWVNGTAYAVYSSNDTSLRFYRDSGTITEGSSYRGREATIVYTDFELTQLSETAIPWYGHRSVIKTVVFEDVIKPQYPSYWFYAFYNCSYVDVTNLDVSNVTNMTNMFTYTGQNAAELTMLGLEGWNTSKVTNMTNMFAYVGRYMTNKILNMSDISGWDVSRVTNMNGMFNDFGKNATNLLLDLSKWDVSKVTSYTNFNTNVTSKVIAPAKFSS